jgi:hypothetical protein
VALAFSESHRRPMRRTRSPVAVLSPQAAMWPRASEERDNPRVPRIRDLRNGWNRSLYVLVDDQPWG